MQGDLHGILSIENRERQSRTVRGDSAASSGAAEPRNQSGDRAGGRRAGGAGLGAAADRQTRPTARPAARKGHRAVSRRSRVAGFGAAFRPNAAGARAGTLHGRSAVGRPADFTAAGGRGRAAHAQRIHPPDAGHCRLQRGQLFRRRGCLADRLRPCRQGGRGAAHAGSEALSRQRLLQPAGSDQHGAPLSGGAAAGGGFAGRKRPAGDWLQHRVGVDRNRTL